MKTTDMAKMIDKAVKLLKLAKDNANANEAAVASEKAQAMLDQLSDEDYAAVVGHMLGWN